MRQLSYDQVEALVFALSYLCSALAVARLTVVATYVVGSKHGAQRVGIVGHHPPSVYQAHALGGRLRGHGILYTTPQLFHRRGGGDVDKVHAALYFGRGRKDLEIDGLLFFGHDVQVKPLP